jgi:DNA repair protein RadA/Sms
MPETRTIFVCQNCGSQFPKWQGKCPDCNAWNSFAEESFSSSPILRQKQTLKSQPIPLCQISQNLPFIPTLPELDRVLGGGIVPASFLLVGGAPGVGKSTLLLQTASAVSSKNKVLYISGEESEFQTRLRAKRLHAEGENLFILHETSLEAILEHLKETKPTLAVIDSIQTLYKSDVSSSPGSVSQVRECAGELLRICKNLGIAIILVGHITKDGSIAGPRVLEHIVDTVLYLEGENQKPVRILRAFKHRFGSTQDVGIFEMTSNGLMSVENPSNLFLQSRAHAPGCVVFPLLEGQRPLLVEIQALVCRSWYGIPKRTVNGIDFNRMNMILAVLEKRCGLSLSQSDVYLNVVGGVKIKEPAADLAVASAVFSSIKEKTIDPHMIVFGELGLGGEVRAVPFSEERLKEATRTGFKKALFPKANLEPDANLSLFGVKTIQEAFQALLENSKEVKECSF